MLNLDTHILIYLLAGELTESEDAHIRNNQLAISGIVLWELAKLIQKKRLLSHLDSREFKSLLLSLEVVPINMEIAQQSTMLDFHGDPADEIIAATSIVLGLPLLTRDAHIRKSKIVPLVR